jgi:ATP phosphoribosyltransferase regulatory subunit
VLRQPSEDAAVRFFDGEALVSLRDDFTQAIARLAVRRFQEPPQPIAYAGSVFRKVQNSWDPVEHVEVGCEYIHQDPHRSHVVDLELARMLMDVPRAIGLRAALLSLGDAALLRRPLEAEQLPEAMAKQIVWAMERRALHRAAEALGDHVAAPRLLAHLEALLAPPDGDSSLAALAQSPYADLLKDERQHLAQTFSTLRPLLPSGLTLRMDLADVKGLDFYTGPTLRLWAPGAQEELAAGGRYDRLFPALGRPWFAAGFCVRLTRLVDLAELHPELFTETVHA